MIDRVDGRFRLGECAATLDHGIVDLSTSVHRRWKIQRIGLVTFIEVSLLVQTQLRFVDRRRCRLRRRSSYSIPTKGPLNASNEDVHQQHSSLTSMLIGEIVRTRAVPMSASKISGCDVRSLQGEILFR